MRANYSLIKLAHKNSNHYFFLTALAAQREEFILQNVAYKPIVYRTGPKTEDQTFSMDPNCKTLASSDLKTEKLSS